MRKSAILFAAVLISVVWSAGSAAPAAGSADAGFEKLKSLVGEWETEAPDGEPVTLRYALIAGGSALEEENSHGDMVTIYHMDGDSVLLTHYCMAKNQPRMRAKGLSADGKTLEFTFVDASNLARSTDMHMRGLKVTFEDADHITQTWVHSMGGKEEPASFKLTRKKQG